MQKKQKGRTLSTTNLPDYRYDPIAYEAEEKARPDEIMMLDMAVVKVRRSLDGRPGARFLDLCCGTGLPMLGIADHENAATIFGVDNSEPYLDFAKARFADRDHVAFSLEDAVGFSDGIGSWDVILLASAYHHIEDDRKLRFLSNVNELLHDDGVVVVAENVLPDYDFDDDDSYQRAVSFFYREVMSYARENGGLSGYAQKLIERCAKYGCDGDYEYKVSMDVFLDHFSRSGFSVLESEKVWPSSGSLCLTRGGNYVFVMRKSKVDST